MREFLDFRTDDTGVRVCGHGETRGDPPDNSRAFQLQRFSLKPRSGTTVHHIGYVIQIGPRLPQAIKVFNSAHSLFSSFSYLTQNCKIKRHINRSSMFRSDSFAPQLFQLMLNKYLIFTKTCFENPEIK